MRNHPVRFVLAACVSAAAAAAQAPTLDNSKFREVGTQNPGAKDPAPASGRTIGDYSPRYQPTSQGEQDPDLYSLNRLFKDAHGDFMAKRERYVAPIELGARVLPNQRIQHEPGSFDLFGYDIDVDLPVLVSTDGYLKFGAYYEGRSYTFSSAFGSMGNASGIGDEQLHAAGLHVGFGVFLDDNVLFEMETSPGLWSDWDDGLHHKDFDYPSKALFTIHTIDNVFLKIGARYNQIYEDAPWLPYLGVSWHVFDGLRFDLLAPEYVELSLWPSASTGILIGGEVTGAQYHVRTTEATGAQRADVQVQEIIAYVGLVHRMNDNVSLRARSGLVVAGDYHLTTGAATFNEAEGALDQGFFAELSFGIDF